MIFRHFFDTKRRTCLIADASPVALDAILIQFDSLTVGVQLSLFQANLYLKWNA